MKKILCSMIPIVCSHLVFSQNWIQVKDASKHTGDTLNLFGLVTNITYLKEPNDVKKTLLSLNDGSSSHAITLITASSSVYKDGDHDSAYLNQYVHVKGLIEMAGRKTFIKINNASQISVVRIAPDSFNYDPE